jgi:hypothetical protein
MSVQRTKLADVTVGKGREILFAGIEASCDFQLKPDTSFADGDRILLNTSWWPCWIKRTATRLDSAYLLACIF